MRSLRLKITDLLETADQSAAGRVLDVTEVTALVLQQFAFLPQPLTITVEGGDVVLQFPEESTAAQEEAARLALKGAKRAAVGDFAGALPALQRALQLQPSLHSARRDLAMAYMELGQPDAATNHLIEVLRVDPSDAWNWVVLGNLYLGPKKDPATGEKFLRKALDLKPGDAWALNSLAALHHQRGQHAEAIPLFQQALATQPDLPQAYLGQALAHVALKQPDQAEALLARLFKLGNARDTRSHPAYAQARDLYARVQRDLAQRDESALFKCVQNYKAELETLSGYPVKTVEAELSGTIGAQIQMAWTHGRDHHLLSTRRGYAPELLCHLQAHELTHLRIEANARKLGHNQFFTTNATTLATAHRALQADADKLRRKGTAPDAIERLHRTLIKGLCGFLFNCPIDMLIERHLRQTYPVLRPAQFLSVRVMVNEALQVNTNPEILKITPRKIQRATLAMNGAYCLFLDDLFEGATTFAAPYRTLENFDMAKQLHHYFIQHSEQFAGGGGREYCLVDGFAELLGIRDWYQWQPDTGQHQVLPTTAPTEGTSNDALLRQLHPAAVHHLLSALQRYDALPVSKVQEITFEAARTGERGLDYASHEKQYTLRSLPGERFSGLQIMCLLHAGLKRLVPGTDTGMDLDEPFLRALELHQQKGGQR
jgi:tetratricopeptide (TPR) repeat protein